VKDGPLNRCRANMALIRQSRPYYGLGIQVQVTLKKTLSCSLFARKLVTSGSYWTPSRSKCPTHTVDYGPFSKSQLNRPQLTFRPYAAQMWSRFPPESGGNEPFVVHRVVVGLRRSVIGYSPLTGYRGTSITRKRLPIGPYSSPMPRALWWS